MKITISGIPGAGKSTLAEYLSKALGYKRYYIGGIMRDMAGKRGMTLAEYSRLCEKDAAIDREVDEYQSEIGKRERDFVIEGRTSYFFIPDSLKIFLDCSLDVAASRILSDLKDPKRSLARNEGKMSGIEEVKRGIMSRMKSERERYRKYYGIKDSYDKSQFDIVIDTTNSTAEKTGEVALGMIQEIQES